MQVCKCRTKQCYITTDFSNDILPVIKAHLKNMLCLKIKTGRCIFQEVGNQEKRVYEIAAQFG